MRGLIVLIIGFMSTCLLQAQNIIDPVQLTIEDGLSQGFISCLHQDKEGFLWIGTKNGLNRYDGKRFEIFSINRNNPYAISSDEIKAIEEEGDFLIIKTGGAKLQLFHKPTKRFYQINLPVKDKVISYELEPIYKDKFGDFWMNTRTGTLNKLIKISFPNQFWELFPTDTTRLHEVESSIILEDGYYISNLNDSTLLVNISGQRALLNTKSLKTDLLPASHPLATFDNRKLFSEQLSIASSKNVFSIFQYDTVKNIATDIPYLNFFYDTDIQKLWVQNFNTSQVFVFPLDTLFNRTALNESEAEFTVLGLKAGMTAWLKDHSGNIWLGTGGYGLLKISPRSLKVKHFAVGQSIFLKPTGKAFNEILFKKSYWRNDYIYTSNEKGALVNIYQFLLRVKEDGFYLAQDKRLDYWLLVRKSRGVVHRHQAILYHFSSDGTITEKWRQENHGDFYMTYDPLYENLLIAVDNQLTAYDTRTGNSRSYPIHLPTELRAGIGSIVQTLNGQIWIGTTEGLIQLQQNGKEVLFDVESSRLLDNNCASLLLDPTDGNVIWIGTKGGGLHRFDTETLEFRHLNSSNGLPNDVIYGVLNDEEGNLWMSSNKGIIRYTPTNGSIRNFTVEDGMQSNEFNTNAYSKAFDGSLLFGGINGLNVFRPEDLVDNPHTPNVRITKLEVNNQSIAPLDSTQILTKAIEFTDEIVLPFSKNNITLEFAALEFTASNKNKYRYYLEGTESEWQNETIDNRATYLNLPPGRHAFWIKAANGDGIWSEEITELWITIRPPWYRTWWAYLGYLLFLIASIGLVISFLQHRLRLQHKVDLEQKEAERLRELDSFRSRLYTNITHEFRTPLTVMLGTNQQLSATENNPERRRKFGLIRRNGNNLLELINQLLDLSKIEHHELTVKYIQGDLLK
ncbi:MAG: histidine kinase dimerization/phospho-acceptor domain-containing protein, partial [Bacteroidota bacterium]